MRVHQSILGEERIVPVREGSPGEEAPWLEVLGLALILKGEGIGIVTARDLVEAYATSNRPLAPRVNWVQWN
jgi:CBS domain-containing protein